MQNRTSSATGPLNIRLIGAFSVTDPEGKSFTLSGRKDRAVLAFLAAHRGRPIARERLVELIWPGAAEGAGRASLRQSLSTIRKALAPFDVLFVDRDTIALNPECADTDIERLESSAFSEPRFGVIPLASGEAFLDDLGGISNDFDTWRATEHSRIASLVSDQIDEVVRQAEAENDLKKGVAALSQLVSLNPLNEAGQRRYMKGLIALGQTNSAIRQYRALERQLHKELGIRPEEATRAVFAEARKTTTAGTARLNAASIGEYEDQSVAASHLPTIVIYRFRNISPDGENEHLAEGLSESILAALSKIPGLSVYSAMSTAPPTEIPGAGSAIYDESEEPFALQGSVLQRGNRVRISVSLIRNVSRQVFWAEDYDREVSDIFALQDDITHEVVVEMRVKLSEGEKVRALAQYTKNLEVWSLLLRADVLTNNLVEQDNIEARCLLEEAVQIDPACAAAWGELADTYLVDYMMGRRTLPKNEYLDQAMRATQKALEVEPGFTHALNTVSFVQMSRGHFDKAVETARKALAAAPRNPEIAANCAYVFAFSGHVDDAEAVIGRAIDATPIPPMWYLTLHGLCLYLQDEPASAIRLLEEAVKLVPESTLPRLYLVGTLMKQGRIQDAEANAEEIHRIQPDFALSNWPGTDFSDALLKQKLIKSLLRAGVKW